MKTHLQFCVLITLLCAASGSPARPITEFFATHCLDCHEVDNAKADLRLDVMLDGADFHRDFAKWEHVLTHLVDRSMPPKRRPARPSHQDYESAIDWLRSRLVRIERDRAEQKPRWMRRLNRAEYNNTIRDLFAIHGLRPAEAFPLDDALHGFDNVAEGLTISPLHIESYLRAAETVLDAVLMGGEKPASRTLRHTFRFHSDRQGDGQLRVRNPTSLLKLKDGSAHWIGGAFHSRFPVRHAGSYQIRVSGVPHRFAGQTAGFVATVNRREHAAFDLRPINGGRFTILDTTARLEVTEAATFEIEWTENHHRLGDKRAGVTERNSPFRQLQKAKKADPKHPEKWLPALGWQTFSDLEISITGPLNDTWPPPHTQRLLAPANGEQDARAILADFLPRAFRRPVEKVEIDHFTDLIDREVAAGEPWMEALKQGLAAALSSPHFIYLVESPPTDADKGDYSLNAFELASRLSYFLWSSMPDDELLASARTGTLAQPEELRRQTCRLLADPRAQALTEGFGEQWMGTRRIPSLMPEPSLFATKFDEYIHRAMATEPVMYFDFVRRENRPITDFLDSDYALVNGPLAAHYGLEGVQGQTFRRVQLTDRRRGGLITQAGFLTMTSEATRTSPVKRGIWILEHLFHRPPPPPPPNAGSLINPDDDTLRPVAEHLAIHREVKACASCHERIDPYGLALERFDAIGAWREKERVVPADQIYLPHWKQKPKFFDLPQETTFDDGRTVRSVADFKDHLLNRRDDFARGFAEQLMIYALGRELLVRDQAAIDQIVRRLREDGYRFNTLPHEIVLSEPFKTR